MATPTIAGRLYQMTKTVYGLRTKLYSVATLRRNAAAAGLAHVSHCYPFFHNVVMVFRAA